jgi:hypothetical protein
MPSPCTFKILSHCTLKKSTLNKSTCGVHLVTIVGLPRVTDAIFLASLCDQACSNVTRLSTQALALLLGSVEATASASFRRVGIKASFAVVKLGLIELGLLQE